MAGDARGRAEASIALDADASSFRVLEGTGGMQSLGDDDKANIHETIEDEVLKGQAISFRSTTVEIAADGSRIAVHGDLTLVGTTRPIELELAVDADRLSGSVVVKQSDWGMSPYSTLFGALKVADDVQVAIDAAVPSS